MRIVSIVLAACLAVATIGVGVWAQDDSLVRRVGSVVCIEASWGGRVQNVVHRITERKEHRGREVFVLDVEVDVEPVVTWYIDAQTYNWVTELTVDGEFVWEALPYSDRHRDDLAVGDAWRDNHRGIAYYPPGTVVGDGDTWIEFEVTGHRRIRTPDGRFDAYEIHTVNSEFGQGIIGEYYWYIPAYAMAWRGGWPAYEWEVAEYFPNGGECDFSRGAADDAADDQEAFEDLVGDRTVEFVFREDTVVWLEFPEPGRFVLTLADDDQAYPGNFAYRSTGPKSARYSLTYDPDNNPWQYVDVVDLIFISGTTGVCVSRTFVQSVQQDIGACNFHIRNVPGR